MAKPGILCKLEKGKMIDSQENFVDTFNWMVDYINNLRGDGTQIELKNATTDRPVITFKGGGITVNGTDGSTASGHTLYIVPDENSVIRTKAIEDPESGIITLEFGVYYK